MWSNAATKKIELKKQKTAQNDINLPKMGFKACKGTLIDSNTYICTY